MDGRRTVIIGVANGYGTDNLTCRDGLEALKALDLFNDPKDALHILHWDELIKAYDHHPDHINAIENIATQRAKQVAQHLWSVD